MVSITPGQVVDRSRFGIDRLTGKTIFGWEHCQQCLWVLAATALNTRVMLLDYGAGIPSLLDKPANAGVIISWYMAIYRAVLKWEPGYRLKGFAIPAGGPDGAFTIELRGTFYPRGHLGDYSIAQTKTATLLFKTAI